MARLVNLPQTFERRGTTVPLVHPGFSHTRVRVYEYGNERRLEAVLPNYFGVRRGELTIIPWEELGGRTTFCDRDVHIMQDILRTRGEQAM